MRKGFDPIYDARQITDLRDMLYGGLEVFGEDPLFLEKDKETGKYTTTLYKDYVKETEYLGTGLMAMGLKDTHVAVIGENRYRWVTSYMAIVNGVGTVVPVDKELPVNEIINVINRCKPSAMFFSGKLDEVIENVAKIDKTVEYFIGMDLSPQDENGRFISYDTIIAKGKEELGKGNREYLDVDIDPKAIKILLFTSATTSQSKAAQLSHYNIASNLMSMVTLIKVKRTDRFLSVLPLHHTYECTCGFLCPLYMGASIAFCEGLKYIVDDLKNSGATIMLGVPLLFEAMYKRMWRKAESSGSANKLRAALKLSRILMKLGIDKREQLFSSIYEGLGGTIRMFISGAAAISPEVAKFFREIGLEFYQGYGLTECSPILALNSDTEYIDASAGKALPGVEIQIWEPNEDGIGEIVAKGPNIIKGYLDEPELNKTLFKDGYFHTGDMGYMDEDGFIFITGRKKFVIVTKNGKNIFPEEIELLINDSPFVTESMVYGEVNKDSGDEIITAAILPDLEAISTEFGKTDSALVEKVLNDLIKDINKKLMNYKKVRNVNVRNREFVKTTTGKIKRYVPENKM